MNWTTKRNWCRHTSLFDSLDVFSASCTVGIKSLVAALGARQVCILVLGSGGRMSLGKISEKKLLRLMYPDQFPPFSLEDVREQICREVSDLLGARVALEERAFHALEVTTAKGTTPSEGHVWRQLAASLPAVTEFQEALGVHDSFKGFSRTKPLDVDLDDVYALDWKRTLRVIFMRGSQPTPIAQDVAQRGLITVGDMALSMLQSSRCMLPTTQKTAYRTNLAFRAIARAAGKRSPVWWNTYLEEFSDKATQAFRRIYSWDPAAGEQQFILFHDGKQVRVRPFGLLRVISISGRAST